MFCDVKDIQGLSKSFPKPFHSLSKDFQRFPKRFSKRFSKKFSKKDFGFTQQLKVFLFYENPLVDFISFWSNCCASEEKKKAKEAAKAAKAAEEAAAAGDEGSDA